jgi:alkylhydroperoxidase family enzyme
MKQDIAGQASLAINKAVDWSHRTIGKSKEWFEAQRSKYSEREFAPPRRKRLEDEEGAGRFKRFWYAFRIARRFYPSTPTSLAPSAAPAASADVIDAILCRSVSPRIHALIRFRAAMRIGAAAAAEQHAIICKQEGWDDEQMNAAAVGYDSVAFSDAERLLLRYADDLSRTPMDIDISVVRQLRQHFSEDQLLEIAASICQENFKARFATAILNSRSRTESAVA